MSIPWASRAVEQLLRARNGDKNVDRLYHARGICAIAMGNFDGGLASILCRPFTVVLWGHIRLPVPRPSLPNPLLVPRPAYTKLALLGLVDQPFLGSRKHIQERTGCVRLNDIKAEPGWATPYRAWALTEGPDQDSFRRGRGSYGRWREGGLREVRQVAKRP